MQPAAHAAVRKAGENWIVTYAGGARLALKVDFVK